MPITSTSGLSSSSDTCCRPISASPLDTSTLTRLFGPPIESLVFGVIWSAMPSFSNIAHDVAAGDAAAGGRGVADGLGGEQRALQRLGRRHVGLRRALAHGDADAGAAKIDAAARDLALLDELVERRGIGQEDIDRLAALEARQQRAGGRVAGANGVAVGALERRQQFIGRGLDRGRDERVDLGGMGGAGRKQKDRDGNDGAHGRSVR